jgi:hypothetical protein
MKGETMLKVTEVTNLYDVEMTDTFGGEANYDWVKRVVVPVTQSTYRMGNVVKERNYRENRIRRATKKALGISGMPGRWENHGDYIVFRPYKLCQIMFVAWHNCHEHCGCKPKEAA